MLIARCIPPPSFFDLRGKTARGPSDSTPVRFRLRWKLAICRPARGRAGRKSRIGQTHWKHKRSSGRRAKTEAQSRTSGLSTKRRGLRSFRGKIQIFRTTRSSVRTNSCPSGDHEPGTLFALISLLVSSSAAPLPSAGCQKRRFLFPLKTIRLPSGVQTGSTLPDPSNVNRVKASRDRS